MSAEPDGGSDAQVPGLVYGGDDAPEVVRLRRENARLRQQLVAKERERELLIARYEALLADATANSGDGGATDRSSVTDRFARVTRRLPWPFDR